MVGPLRVMAEVNVSPPVIHLSRNMVQSTAIRITMAPTIIYKYVEQSDFSFSTKSRFGISFTPSEVLWDG